jgi:hypothetical protein
MLQVGATGIGGEEGHGALNAINLPAINVNVISVQQSVAKCGDYVSGNKTPRIERLRPCVKQGDRGTAATVPGAFTKHTKYLGLCLIT